MRWSLIDYFSMKMLVQYEQPGIRESKYSEAPLSVEPEYDLTERLDWKLWKAG
jgi:outer membrane receptor for ferrienterochelin and colicin